MKCRMPPKGTSGAPAGSKRFYRRFRSRRAGYVLRALSSSHSVDTSAREPGIGIRLLGEFRVVRSGPVHEPARFRSRTAERLLALLALRLGQMAHRGELLEALWPESDGDRQAQNLRRALSDVRQVLEEDPRAAVVVCAQGDRIWLDADRVQTDVERFKRLTDSGLEGADFENDLREAIRLYAGPLLPGFADPSFHVYRMELEERFGQAVERMIGALLRSERQEEALRIGRQAVVAAPLREDVHLALTSAYASAGLRAEAIRQFEDLEALLDAHWGEKPSPRSVAAFEALWREADETAARARTGREPPPREAAGGAVPLGSPFYVTRECDRVLKRAILRGEGTVLVDGPRQVGKTSLLSRVLTEARRSDVRIAITDFQILSRSQLATADALCRALAYGFAVQIGAGIDFRTEWNEWIGPNSNLHATVEAALRRANAPVVWAMDEVDRLFGTGLADDFFGLVRSWHNLRAMDAESPFTRLTLVVSYATEAHLFIQDINQSPFNVGLRIPMRDFGESEVGELCLRYGARMSPDDVRRLMELTNGQPFLTRKALDALVHGGYSLGRLEKAAAQEEGPFGEHLRRMLYVTSRNPAIAAEVRRFLGGEPFVDPQTSLRLVAGGMLRREPDGRLRFRVPAYGEFLAKYLT